MKSVFVEQFCVGGNGPRVAIKDTIDIAGYPTKAGSRVFEHVNPAKEHAKIVHSLINNQCELIGKTVLHELAFGMTGINEWSGSPVNYKYPDLIVGGSSSGSAVAVAEGSADFSIGTDTGGSIRLPSACCGIYGLKPTFGRISRTGVLPVKSSLDCVGPFARSMDMLIKAMTFIDSTFQPIDEIQDIKIGWVDTKADIDIKTNVKSFIKSTNQTVIPVELEGLDDAFNAGMTIINIETWNTFGEYVINTPELIGQDVRERLLNAKPKNLNGLASAEAVRKKFTAEIDSLLNEVAVLALPTLPNFPMRRIEALSGKRDISISSLIRPFNLSGHPALSIPLVSQNSLPLSLQLIARKGEDELLCEVGRLLSTYDGVEKYDV